MYFAYIQSVISYGILLWGPMARKSSIKLIRNQQKKIIRILDAAKYNSNTSPIFKKWKILKLDDLIDLNLHKFAYNFTHKNLPLPVLNLLKTNDFNHNYGTRFGSEPCIEKHKSATYSKSFLCNAPSNFRKLSIDLTSVENVKLFAKRLCRTRFESY